MTNQTWQKNEVLYNCAATTTSMCAEQHAVACLVVQLTGRNHTTFTLVRDRWAYSGVEVMFLMLNDLMLSHPATYVLLNVS